MTTTKPQSTEPPDSIWLPADTGADTWNILAKNPSRDWSTGEPANNIEYRRVFPASTAPVVDESSVAFASYNKAIEDAMAAIRAESQGGGYWAATFINAIARRCSPHVYVASLSTEPRTHEAPDPYRPVCKYCGLADIAGDWNKYPCNDEWRKDIATNY